MGGIIQSIWKSLLNHHDVELDTFQLMPNHVHFILGLTGKSTGASRRAPTIGMLVGFLKSESTKQIRRLTNDAMIEIWQRNYYEHIIRTDVDLDKIRAYIQFNPEMWERDRNNPKFA